MIGGLFGLTLPPFLLVHSSLVLMDRFIYPLPQFSYIYAGLLALYTGSVLLLDNNHQRPHPLHKLRKSETYIEERSAKFWRTHFDYFPMRINPSSPPPSTLNPDRQYIFGVHPHGIHCWALNMLAFQMSPFDAKYGLTSEGRMTGLAASVIFQIPVVRELFLACGYIDAGRRYAQKALENKRNLFVCTGGEEESMLTELGRDVVVLNKRKGFVRLAVSYGACLVPVFGAGISDLYTTYGLGLGLRMWIQKKTGVALPFFHGRWFSPLPYQLPIDILIGEPIEIAKEHMPKEKGGKPEEKWVDFYHHKYIEALKDLHKREGGGRVLIVK